MEKLQTLITAEQVKRCLSGVPVNLDGFSDHKLQQCALMMVHCCMNGPVGVHKETEFPGGINGSIRGILGVECSNSSWATTCIPFAKFLQKEYPELVSKCQQVRLKKGLWPLNALPEGDL
jgi:hypothetical protein